MATIAFCTITPWRMMVQPMYSAVTVRSHHNNANKNNHGLPICAMQVTE